MDRVLICFPSTVLLEQVWEQVDHGVQSLSTQSLEQGTWQATGSGGGVDDEHKLSSNGSPEHERDTYCPCDLFSLSGRGKKKKLKKKIYFRPTDEGSEADGSIIAVYLSTGSIKEQFIHVTGANIYK